METAVWGTYYNVVTNLKDIKDEELRTKVGLLPSDLKILISYILLLKFLKYKNTYFAKQ